MSDTTVSHIAPTAARILSVAIGQPIRLSQASRLRNRSDIWRFQVLDALPPSPASVVVKVVSASNNQSADPSEAVRLRRLFCNEWTGLVLLQQLIDDPPLTPRFYGADTATGILVIEDLGTSSTLWDQLQGHDSQAATTQLIALATALGRMHAQTMCEQPRFEQICAELALDQPPTDFEEHMWISSTFTATAATLGIPLMPKVMDDLALLTQLLTEPDPFRAYTQGDPSPGNCLFVAPTMRLLDFGAGAYRHAFVDFPPPWCWQQIPPSVMRQMIDAYQVMLAEGCAAAADPVRFTRGLVEGGAYWSAMLLKDWPLSEVAVNVGMRRNLLQVLESFVELSQQATHLEALGALVAAIAETIRRRWPIDIIQPAYYSAFQES